MAAARPYWKGYLKLSLVSCPIALYTATSSSERVAFRQINRRTGHRLRQQLVDDVTREPVEAADKARGYEYDKDSYVLVEDAELEAIAVESSHTIEIDKFVPRADIDERYLDSSYYIAPSDEIGQEAFAVIREAMRGKAMAALGRVVLAKRERVIMLQPWERGLLGTTLRYAYEVKASKDFFDDIPQIKVPGEMLKLAEHIIQGKEADFDPSDFVDHYEEAVVAMLKEKQEGVPSKARPKAEPQKVINLMDALKRSLANDQKQPAKKKAGKKRAEGQREMLLPISGKGERAAPAAAKSPAAAKPAGKQRRAG